MKIKLEPRGNVVWASVYNKKGSNDEDSTYWENTLEAAMALISSRIKTKHPSQGTKFGAILWG